MDLEGKLGLEKRYALQRERLELIQTRLLDLTKGSLGQVEGKALEELVALEQLVAQLIEDS